MRSLVNTKDIIEEANRAEVCPTCSPETPLEIVKSTLDFCRQTTTFVVSKIGYCPVHGVVNVVRSVKTANLYGKNAEITPRYS